MSKYLLEGRQIEYVKKKLMYKKYNIIPLETPEQEYQITKQDLVKIRRYINKFGMSVFDDMVNVSGHKFRNDKLTDSFQIKRINRQNELKRNIKRKKNIFTEDIGEEFKFFRDGFHKPMKNKYKLNQPEYGDVYFDEFHNECEVPMNELLHYGKNDIDKNYLTKVNEVIGNAKTYKSQLMSYQNPETSFDIESKMVLPNFQCNDKRENKIGYMSMPMMKFDQDIDVDTYMRYGETPSRGSRSLGYPNPVDHYFSYINDDFQKPEHTVMDRGYPSRKLNKIYNKTGKVYKRDIMQ